MAMDTMREARWSRHADAASAREGEVILSDVPPGLAAHLLRLVIADAPVVLVVLDPSGTVIMREGTPLDILRQHTDVGRSIFELHGHDSPVTTNFRRALAGETTSFLLELHGTSLDCRMEPVFAGTGELTHVIGMAVDVTSHLTSERASSRLASFVGHNPLPVLELDAFGHVTYANAATRSAFSTRALSEAVAGLCELHASLSDGGASQREVAVSNRLWVQHVVRVDSDCLRVYMVEVTDERAAAQALRTNAAGQEAVARLGTEALAGASVEEVMDRAADAVTTTLDLPMCAVMVLRDDGRTLVMGGGKGWDDGVVGHAVVDVDAGSQATFTLATRDTVIVPDCTTEARFTPPDMLVQHAVRSSMSTAIRADGRNLGLMCAHDVEERCFTHDEARFLESMANVVGAALERSTVEEEIRRRALHDPITGLPNRTLVLDRLEIALARMQRGDAAQVGVFFLDIDEFKVVNDGLGHETGDHLITAIADRLTGVVRPADTVGRFGGDEFVVVCEDVPDRSAAREVVERVADAFREPFSVGLHQLVVSASVGIVLADRSSVEAESLVRDADAAMYEAKRAGRSCHRFFEPGMRRAAVDRLDTEQALRRALDTGDQIVVHYQPAISLESGKIVALESLVRWQQPGRGLVPPSGFVPLAEETALITPLGAIVLERACRDAKRWSDRWPDRSLVIAVNASARELSQPDYVDKVKATLATTGLDPSMLGLEITESAVMTDLPSARRLQELKDVGTHVGLDDFGTGHSSLSYLMQLPLDALKIDRSFVRRLGDAADATTIVRAIIGLAHDLGLGTIAEGVETGQQLDMLRAMGCDMAQGFFISRPVPGHVVEELLAADPEW